jgi:uncharacterized protein (TIGR02453 family)
MAYFTKDFISFFKALENNNNSTWLSENRKVYDTAVRKPFEEFVEELIIRLALEEPSMAAELSDTLFRLKKEERVGGKDKPFRESMSACIGKHGRFDRTVPHLYIECDTDGVLLTMGVQSFDKQALENFRQFLISDFKALKYIQSRAIFVETFGRIHADRFQHLPEEWKSYGGAVPWLHSKNMYIQKVFPKEILLSHNLTDIIMEHFYIGLDFLNLLKSAMKKQQRAVVSAA